MFYACIKTLLVFLYFPSANSHKLSSYKMEPHHVSEGLRCAITKTKQCVCFASTYTKTKTSATINRKLATTQLHELSPLEIEEGRVSSLTWPRSCRKRLAELLFLLTLAWHHPRHSLVCWPLWKRLSLGSKSGELLTCSPQGDISTGISKPKSFIRWQHGTQEVSKYVQHLQHSTTAPLQPGTYYASECVRRQMNTVQCFVNQQCVLFAFLSLFLGSFIKTSWVQSCSLDWGWVEWWKGFIVTTKVFSCFSSAVPHTGVLVGGRIWKSWGVPTSHTGLADLWFPRWMCSLK